MKKNNFFLVIALLFTFSYSQDDNVDYALGLYLSSEFETKINKNEENGYDLRDSSFRYVRHLSQKERLNFYLSSYFFSRMLDTAYLGDWGNEISCNGDYKSLKEKLDSLLLQPMYRGGKERFENLKSFLDHRSGKCLTVEEMSL